MGESTKKALRVHFDARARLEFHGATLTSNGGLLACRELDDALGLTEAATRYLQERRLILDMDSSDSPVYGEHEGAAYNGHFACVCSHPLFCFNQFGDCEGAMLRPGNVHSAHGWQEVLEPILARYERCGVRRYFRADAALASPKIYEYLEEHSFL